MEVKRGKRHLGILFLFQVASKHQINHKIGAEAAFVFRSGGGEARTYAQGEPLGHDGILLPVMDHYNSLFGGEEQELWRHLKRGYTRLDDLPQKLQNSTL